MKIYIKNMVCIRCKMVVKAQLKKIGLENAQVKLGEAEITGTVTDAQLNDLKTVLRKFGLEVLDDKKGMLIDKIKKVTVELIHYEDGPLKINFSVYLSKKLNYGYTYMANLFSEVEGINVEHYLISHKIERVKELLVYDKL